MGMEERRAENQGVRLHYLDSRSDTDASLVPLLFVHGAIGRAEYFRSEMAVYAPRRCLALSRRGMGQSDAPATGYSFEDQVTDVEAVIKDAGLKFLCIMAYSMGVGCSNCFGLRHPPP